LAARNTLPSDVALIGVPAGAAISSPPCGFFLIPLRILWLP
jgi:hypothetical protein